MDDLSEHKEVGIAPDISEVADEIYGPGTGAEPEASSDLTVKHQPAEPHGEQDAVYYGEDRQSVARHFMAAPPSILEPPNSAVGNPLGGPQVNMQDVGQNSFEQDVAYKQWVDMVVDKLNRGEDPNMILAELAHDGCPDPQGALERAMKQPTDATDMNQAQDPNIMPADQQGGNLQGNEMSSLSKLLEMDEAQPIEKVAHTRVEVDGREGWQTFASTDVFGLKTVHVAFDDGGSSEVPADRVQEIADKVNEPADKIQEFLNKFPEADPKDPASVADRVSNLRHASHQLHSMLSSGLSTPKVYALTKGVDEEIQALRTASTAILDLDTKAMTSSTLREASSNPEAQFDPERAGDLSASRLREDAKIHVASADDSNFASAESLDWFVSKAALSMASRLQGMPHEAAAPIHDAWVANVAQAAGIRSAALQSTERAHESKMASIQEPIDLSNPSSLFL